MRPKKIRSVLAEMMGWEYDSEVKVYNKGDGCICEVLWPNDWQPDNTDTQARQCAEKFCKESDIDIRCQTYEGKWYTCAFLNDPVTGDRISSEYKSLTRSLSETVARAYLVLKKEKNDE